MHTFMHAYKDCTAITFYATVEPGTQVHFFHLNLEFTSFGAIAFSEALRSQDFSFI